MATRSYITIETIEGHYHGIYCHYDGYPQGVGKILLNHYNTREKVLDLIKHGNMSSLGPTLDTCRFYEPIEPSDTVTIKNVESAWCDYWYRYRLDGVWEVMDMCDIEHTEVIPVNEALLFGAIMRFSVEVNKK